MIMTPAVFCQWTVMPAHVDRLMDIPNITEMDWYCFRSYPAVYPMRMMGSRLL